MLKTTGSWIAVAAILILLFGLFLFRDKLKSLWGKLSPAEQPQPTASAVADATVDLDKVLKRGSRGEEVKQLQSMMGALSIDGIFGEQTENRLFTVKGVREITLRAYPVSPDIRFNGDNEEEPTDSWTDYVPFGYLFQ